MICLICFCVYVFMRECPLDSKLYLPDNAEQKNFTAEFPQFETNYAK